MCGSQPADSVYGDSKDIPTDNMGYGIDQKIYTAFTSEIQYDCNQIRYSLSAAFIPSYKYYDNPSTPSSAIPNGVWHLCHG